MGFDFFPTTAHPAAPIVGDVSNGYTWDGEKWTMGAGTSAPASSANPKPLGPVAPGVATPYSREDHVHPTDFTVRYDSAQALTGETPPYGAVTQRSQARMNIYAAPFDALAYSGIQINGAMQVSQEKGAAGTTTNGGFVVDGSWVLNTAGTVAVTAQQASSATLFPGLPNFLQITVQTPEVTRTGSDGAYFISRVEGYRISRLGWGTPNAQPLTIGFWTAHVRTGTYSVHVRSTSSRSYVTTYTQNISGAAEYKTTNVPGDTAGGVG